MRTSLKLMFGSVRSSALRWARIRSVPLVLAAMTAGCGAGGHDTVVPGAGTRVVAGSIHAAYPQSQSPGSFKPVPMPLTQPQPAGAMAVRSGMIRPQSIGALTWSQISGSAASAAVAPDGSIWALSKSPAGADKYLWHEKNGTWTNVPGLAANIAVGPDGTLYAVNMSGFNVYAYNGSSWRSLGGGARWVTTGADGAVYVLSNAGIVGGDSAIWKYAGGVWTQQPGVGAQIAGSWDPKTYAVAGFGTIAPNGYFVLDSDGEISYQSPGIGYVPLPGRASSIAAGVGGAFELDYPPAPAGSQTRLLFFDYSYGWAPPSIVPGAGIQVASGNGSGGTGTQLVVVNATGAIWTTPVVAAGSPIVEYPLPSPSGSPQDIAAGPDGALWFTEPGGSCCIGKIGRITTGGRITEFTLSGVSLPSSITAGPDGALWFTDNIGKIGRITTGGSATEYSLPTVSTAPYDITAGPDGALWFTEASNTINKIARITTSGKITEFALSAEASFPWGITTGPDGALWFAEYGPGKIGRITTGGVITAEYLLPLRTGSGPQDIVSGPDGALWFTEGLARRIGRITTAGKITEFTLSSDSMAADITAGPDGALWFTEAGVGKIGRITTAGLVTEYPVPVTNGSAGGIATGPDGALWFTDYFSNGIGKFTLAATH